MQWPQRFCLNFMSLLPKPDAAKFRNVAQTLMLYMVWGICWRPEHVLPWEGRNQAEWDCAKAGVGVLDVAYSRAMEAEVDRYNGLTYGAMLCAL